MDSDNEKKQRAAGTTNAKELNNGCAKQVEGEQAKGAAGEAASEVGGGAAAAATEEAAAVKGTTAETGAVEEATAAAVTTDKTSATSSTTAATTDAKQLNNNNNNNCAVKEKGKKVNGLKQQLDKKKAQTAAAAPVINGLPNGKLQSGEKEQQQQVLEQSVQPVKENESQQSQPAPPPINGKTKKNNHRIPVNHISKESSEKELLKPSVAAAEPPPNKKPKLELHNKSDVAANLPEVAAAEADLPPPAQPVCNEDELEDTSDEAYLVRHQRALIEERRRFETFLKLSWTNRSRANRRADSRAESSGANTPDPASPAASLHLAGPAGDNESIPSPLAQTMQHPLDAISNEGDVPATTKRQERRRTTSSKLKEHERRSATPDTREVSKGGEGRGHGNVM